jgi:hypothetical protein
MFKLFLGLITCGITYLLMSEQYDTIVSNLGEKAIKLAVGVGF